MPDKEAFLTEASDSMFAWRHQHSHITPLLAAYIHGNAYSFVFPWEESDLLSFWRTHSDHNSRTSYSGISTQLHSLTSALESLHSQGLVHRDIKPTNILRYKDSKGVNNFGVLRLHDFGLSTCPPRRGRYYRPHRAIHEGGTRQYAAPERELGKQAISVADVWSMGCVFVETVTWMLYEWAGVVELRRLIGDDPLYELGGPGHITPLRLLIRQVSAEICPSVAGHHNSHIPMSLKVDLWSP